VAYIVLLEDYQEVAEVMYDALRSEGHRCFVIRSRRVAERFLSRVRPDLVVVDCLLIGGDGLELAGRLASNANVPVIVVSATKTELPKLSGPDSGVCESLSGWRSWSPRSRFS
jgi:DNA-binding response OmpR family regulator